MVKKQKNANSQEVQKDKPAARPKSKAKKIISISLVIVETTLMILILLLTITIMTSNKKEDGSISKDPIFKLSFMPVVSESMDPFFKKGDLIIVKAVDTSTLEVGDVITFRFYKDGSLALNTHRIIELLPNGFKTQGDNVPDAEKETTFEEVAFEDVVAVYKGKISGLGNVVEALKTPVVFFLAIITPLIVLFMYNVFLIVRLLIKYNVQRATSKAPAAAASAELTEEMKQRAIEEYLSNLSKDKPKDGTE